jgi:hypothetical protein
MPINPTPNMAEKIQTRSLWFEKVLPTRCEQESGGGGSLEFAH